MPRSVRFTSFDFDQSKYDSMLSDIEAIEKETLDDILGLARVHFVRTSDDHMMVMSAYESMEELETANAAHASIFGDFAKYITGEPIIRSGEIIVAVDGPAPSVGYMRFTRAIFDPSKYDAMMSVVDGGVLDKYKDVPGLSRLLLVRVNETHMIAASGYVSKEAADAARENTDASLASVSEYMTAEPLIRQGNLVWLYQYNL